MSFSNGRNEAPDSAEDLCSLWRPMESRDLLLKLNLNSAVKEDENGADTRKHTGF